MTLVDVRRLEFLREDERRKNSLAGVGAAFDEKNKLIDGIEKRFDFNLQSPAMHHWFNMESAPVSISTCPQGVIKSGLWFVMLLRARLGRSVGWWRSLEICFPRSKKKFSKTVHESNSWSLLG
jgi:hypothetical protein